MTPSQSLHTAARRYCLEREAYWTKEYSNLIREGKDRKGEDYTDEAWGTFPRYHAWDAILLGVEELDNDNLPANEELIELLCVAGMTSDNMFTKDPSHPLEKMAISEERVRFCEHIKILQKADLSSVESMFYRRVLKAEEIVRLRSLIEKKWGAKNEYWFPLADSTHPSLLAFNTEAFDAQFSPQKLQEWLTANKVPRVYELREYGRDHYLLESSIWEPHYNGAEGFWTSDMADWIMYASHESSITVGGTLSDWVKQSWSDWEAKEWKSPM
jgi:hypothetical protein